MLSIVLIGTGNVATHLFNAFYAADGVRILQLAGRNEMALKDFEDKVGTTTDLRNLAVADIYIIAINDDSIKSVYKQFNFKNKLIVHTSGSHPLPSLNDNNRAGVFYPLQTFSKQLEVDFGKLPICIEADNEKDTLLLEELGNLISNSVHRVTSDQRKALHLAAVFVNNFTNHLFSIAYEICEEHGLSFELLLPLIKETMNKLEKLSPEEAQTGPARRRDEGTIEKHRALLTQPAQKEVYSILSDAISKKYGKKL